MSEHLIIVLKLEFEWIVVDYICTVSAFRKNTTSWLKKELKKKSLKLTKILRNLFSKIYSLYKHFEILIDHKI